MSFRETVGAVLALNRTREVPSEFVPVVEMNDQVVRERCFGSDYDVDDEARVIASYEAHNAAVRAGVAPERLLEFDVAEGWERLCSFLDVPAPESEFPNINDREQFRQLFGLDGAQQDVDASRTADAAKKRFSEVINRSRKPSA